MFLGLYEGKGPGSIMAKDKRRIRRACPERQRHALNAASGLELVKDLCIQHPSVAPLVLSMHEEELYAELAMRAGARGYVRKRETSKNILAAIRRVLEGGIYVSEKLSNAMELK